MLALLVGWAWAGAAPGGPFALRALHLVTSAPWIGRALRNITVAVPAGRERPTVAAVLSGALQFDRSGWVVRLSLPTIIVTGLLMAGAYRVLPLTWWVSFTGVLIPVKVLAILALVIVFITCSSSVTSHRSRACATSKTWSGHEPPSRGGADRRHPPSSTTAGRAARSAGALLEIWTRDRWRPSRSPSGSSATATRSSARSVKDPGPAATGSSRCGGVVAQCPHERPRRPRPPAGRG